MKKKLQLRNETIRNLSSDSLTHVVGGGPTSDLSAALGCSIQPHSKFGHSCDSKCSSCPVNPL